MSELVIASSEADAHAAGAVKQHHATMTGALSLRIDALFTVAAQRDTTAAEVARRELIDWCERELVPHALAEEQAMHPAARATVEGRLLVEAMLGEHEVLTRLIREVADASDLQRAAASATALVDGPGYPELDVRSVPHVIRHATIFGALESVRPGTGLDLVAPHDPLPLLDQVNQRWPGVFAVTYRERGPEAWRLSLVRSDA